MGPFSRVESRQCAFPFGERDSLSLPFPQAKEGAELFITLLPSFPPPSPSHFHLQQIKFLTGSLFSKETFFGHIDLEIILNLSEDILQ